MTPINRASLTWLHRSQRQLNAIILNWDSTSLETKKPNLKVEIKWLTVWWAHSIYNSIWIRWMSTTWCSMLSNFTVPGLWLAICNNYLLTTFGILFVSYHKLMVSKIDTLLIELVLPFINYLSSHTISGAGNPLTALLQIQICFSGVQSTIYIACNHLQFYKILFLCHKRIITTYLLYAKNYCIKIATSKQ